jgi:hypothetical protein
VASATVANGPSRDDHDAARTGRCPSGSGLTRVLLGFIQPLLLLSIWFEASGIQLYRLDESPNRNAMLLLHHIIIKICRHGIPKFTAFMSIPFFSRDLISESLDPASGSQKGILSHDAPLTQLTNGHHDPVIQMLPDHVNFAKSRVAQRCLVNIYQSTRGTRFGAEATRTFREERLHPWLTP